MDSKYSIISKSKSHSSDPSTFNLKRKFSYGTSTSSPQAKKPNLQTDTKQLSKQNFAQNAATTSKCTATDIQMQRRRLPVFAVRNQYVNLTTIFCCAFLNHS